MDEPGKYYDANLHKLDGLTDPQFKAALHKCRIHLRIKLKQRSTFGAHTVRRLGEDPIDYYTQYGYNAIVSGNWLWKDGRTLGQQMIRIIDSTMSTEVDKFRTGKEPEVIDQESNEDFYADDPLPDAFEFTKEVLINKQVDVLEEAIKGDDELEMYWECIKAKMKRVEIAAFMEITVKKQDKLREKLIDMVRQSPYFEM
jgi:hypothetical protein